MAQTPLNALHRSAGAKMVPFAGWDMPVHYGSQMEEHHAVRQDVGMFDVSHMTVIDVTGSGGRAFLRRVLANDVDRMPGPGKAQYGTMLNEQGGIIDDLIAYRRADDYRLVTNAGTRDAVLPWLQACQQRLQIEDLVIMERPEMALIAVQGPKALAALQQVLGIDLAAQANAFEFVERDQIMLARTGYTGEDGGELVLPATQAVDLWQQLAAAGVRPIGLGARDTLRLEAGLNLYGEDMTTATSPLVSNLAWTVPLKDRERDFIGRDALLGEKAAGVRSRLVGVVLQERGVIRHGYKVLTNSGEGVITSGIFSPTLGYSIGLARVPQAASGEAQVVIRNKQLPVTLTRPPFVRNGERAWQ
ncbi:MAG: glycine cleavage system aminomethyltransferase GcvT [Pseudomonadales bacterium]